MHARKHAPSSMAHSEHTKQKKMHTCNLGKKSKCTAACIAQRAFLLVRHPLLALARLSASVTTLCKNTVQFLTCACLNVHIVNACKLRMDMHAYTRTYMHARVNRHACTHTDTRACAHTHARTYTFTKENTLVCKRRCTHSHASSCMHMCRLKQLRETIQQELNERGSSQSLLQQLLPVIEVGRLLQYLFLYIATRACHMCTVPRYSVRSDACPVPASAFKGKPAGFKEVQAPAGASANCACPL